VDRVVDDHAEAREVPDAEAGHADVADRLADLVLAEDELARDADAVDLAELGARARPRLRRHLQDRPVRARAGAAEGDAVLLDREVLAVRAGRDEDRVAGLRGVDRRLDRLARRDAVEAAARAAGGGGEARGGAGDGDPGDDGGELDGADAIQLGLLFRSGTAVCDATPRS
jgi:hypothetical protein